jgi:hypothetical protein
MALSSERIGVTSLNSELAQLPQLRGLRDFFDGLVHSCN